MAAADGQLFAIINNQIQMQTQIQIHESVNTEPFTHKLDNHKLANIQLEIFQETQHLRW